MRFDSTEAPLKKPSECAVAFLEQGSYFQKGKDSSIPQPQKHLAVGTPESDNLARFHHTTNVNPTSGLTTGQLTGIEQKIISSIKTFRKRN